MEDAADSSLSSLPSSRASERMARWAYLLDDAVRIPFTRIRFGLDVVLGLLPVFGDFAGLICGLPILVAGVRRRLPFRVLLVMALNVLLDAVVGSVPVAGNIFDVAWRAHRKNLRLLVDPQVLPEIVREAWWKVGALAGIVVLLTVLFAGLMIFAISLLTRAPVWRLTMAIPLVGPG